jgi:hypothetical protein
VRGQKELSIELGYISENLKLAQKQLHTLESELDVIKSCTQPTKEELFKEMFTGKYFKISESMGKYEYILGGDGRSRPWSEMRNGLICKVTINNDVYIDYTQEKCITTVIKEMSEKDIKKVEFCDGDVK